MNAGEIIKSIEAEQLKAEVPEFRVGDTVKVYGRRYSSCICKNQRG